MGLEFNLKDNKSNIKLDKLYREAKKFSSGLNYDVITGPLHKFNKIDDIHKNLVEKGIIEEMNFFEMSIPDSKTKDMLFKDSHYGGNQCDIADMVYRRISEGELSEIEYKKTETLLSLANKYFGKSGSLTDDAFYYLAYFYSQSGCAYMATANSFICYIGNIPNGEAIFKEKFGYDLIIRDNSGNESYNVEALAFEFFLHRNRQGQPDLLDNGKIGWGTFLNSDAAYAYYTDSAKYYYTDQVAIDEYATSLCKIYYNVDDNVDSFFKEHGIIAKSKYIEISKTDILGSLARAIEQNADNKTGLILESENFSLRYISGYISSYNQDIALANAKLGVGNTLTNLANHAMMITEVRENGDVIVSSWAGKYKFIPQANNGFTSMIRLDFALE